MQHRFNVLVRELRAALLFASTDESRFLLNGVHFEVRPNKAPILVSTDGRRLCVIETEAQQPESALIETDLILSTSFLKPFLTFANSQALTLGIEPHLPKRVLFHLPEAKTVLDHEDGAVIEGNFPNWRQTIPTGEKLPVNEIGFSGEYLADFNKAAKLLDCETPMLRMNLFDKDSTVEIHLVGKPCFYGLLMPIKSTDKPLKQPEFLTLNGHKE